MAHRYWPNQDPIGKRFRTGRECDKGRGMSTEIVGIARDGKYNALTEAPQPHLYLPFAQHFQGFMALLVQTAVEPKAAMAPIRQELVRLDRNIRIYQFTTLTDHVATSFWEVRWQASVLGAFGLLALLLASMGLYGVMAYSVAQRTHEIGVRMALGAQSRDVQRLIVRQAMGLTLTGIGLGLALSLAVTRFLIGFLYGLSPTDPVAFVGAVLLWTAVALLASYCPARRATKVDPMVALRYE
jgi:putative ABC transport system permease protein